MTISERRKELFHFAAQYGLDVSQQNLGEGQARYTFTIRDYPEHPYRILHHLGTYPGLSAAEDFLSGVGQALTYFHQMTKSAQFTREEVK